jgi:hypothetical protein
MRKANLTIEVYGKMEIFMVKEPFSTLMRSPSKDVSTIGTLTISAKSGNLLKARSIMTRRTEKEY